MIIKTYKFSLDKWNMQFEILRASGKYDPHIHYNPFKEVKWKFNGVYLDFQYSYERYFEVDRLKTRYPNNYSEWLRISKMWFNRLSEEYIKENYIKCINKINEEYKTNFSYEDFVDAEYIEIATPEDLVENIKKSC